MYRYSTVLVRDDNSVIGFQSKNSLSTDALSAIESIPGTKDVEIITEENNEVTISYVWKEDGSIMNTNDYLSKFGVKKK